MSEITLGILGGGQLGSMLSVAAKKLNIKTIIFCDDQESPAQIFVMSSFILNMMIKMKFIILPKK